MYSKTEQNIAVLMRTFFTDTYKPTNLKQHLANAPSELVQNVPAGRTFIQGGLPANRIYMMLTGSAKVVVCSTEGICTTVDRIDAPHLFGITEVIQKTPYFGASVITSASCHLVCVPAQQYLRIINEDLACAQVTIRYLAWLATRNMDKSELKAVAMPIEILGKYLYERCAGNPLPYIVPATRKQISEELNINLRTLYRYLDILKARGLADVQQRKIIITPAAFSHLKELHSTMP